MSTAPYAAVTGPRAGKLLVTGATGFLGGAIVSRLIETSRWEDVMLLVRTRNSAEGVVRVIENLKRFQVPAILLARVRPSQILCGDFLQVDAFANDPRLGDIADVVNCSAVTSFGRQPLIRKVNVEGTGAFAEMLVAKAKLRRFIHVGTAMSCGLNAVNPVAENDVFPENAEHAVSYTESKLDSEKRLRRIPGLPLVVVRPSIIVGHSRLGCRPSSSIYWVFRMGFAMECFLCDFDTQIDVVSVDYCADIILRILDATALQGTLYHISAGPEHSSTFREIDGAIAAALGREPISHYRQVDYAFLRTMSDRFPELLGPCNKKVILRAIQTYGTFATLGLVFRNDRLQAEGFPLPPRFTEYAGQCALTSMDRTIAEQMATDFK
jgi:nucleoside-diphosphate-sugar epimerase